MCIFKKIVGGTKLFHTFWHNFSQKVQKKDENPPHFCEKSNPRTYAYTREPGPETGTFFNRNTIEVPNSTQQAALVAPATSLMFKCQTGRPRD